MCNKIIDNGNFCADDWQKIHFLQKPACSICFHPFEFKVDEEMTCAACLQRRPSYFKAISAINYDENSKILITNFKYFDQISIAKYFAQTMLNQAKDIMPDIDIICPVPLHKLRLIKRRYNQAALLTKNLSKLSGKKTILDLLIRTKNVKPQASLRKKSRQRNVIGIFALNKKYLEEIKEKNILLIDDVITTGATLEACSRVLKKAKIGRVYVLTIAKTVIR
jgi:ComF family protein